MSVKRTMRLMSLILIAFSSLAGCGLNSRDKSGPIKIGFVGPLTGDGQPWGETQRNAIKMLVDETNANGGILGRKVELIPYDNRGDNTESANVARRLIQKDKVCAILGPNASGAAISMASICDESKVPMIATNATNVNVTLKDGKVRPYVFRVTFTDPQLGGIIAQYAYNEKKIRKVAVFYEIGSDFSMGVQKAFVDTFTGLGGTVLTVEAFKTGDVDFRAQLSKIKEANPEAIFFPTTYKQIGLGANQARELGIKSVFLGTDTWSAKDILKLAGPAIEGSYFAATLDLYDPILDGIKARYFKLFNEKIDDMGTPGFFGYDAYKVLEAAIIKAGSDNPVAIRGALEATTDVQGCIGKLTLDPSNHNPTRPAAIMTIQNGDYKTITSYTPGK